MKAGLLTLLFFIILFNYHTKHFPEQELSSVKLKNVLGIIISCPGISLDITQTHTCTHFL